jgi:hypothetical protein
MIAARHIMKRKNIAFIADMVPSSPMIHGAVQGWAEWM